MNPETLLDPIQVSDYLKIDPHTLANWRSKGFGPKYFKVGRLPRYRFSDVEAWLTDRASDSNCYAIRSGGAG